MLLHVARKYGDTFWLSTWVYNTPAIAFYKHLGFVDIGEIKFKLGNESHENRVLAVKNILVKVNK